MQTSLSSTTATIRIARHFLGLIRDLVVRHKAGGSSSAGALEAFDEELPQILRSYAWLCSMTTTECLELRCAYMTAGATLFEVQLPPGDHLRMLADAFQAASQLGDSRRARLIGSNMGVLSRRLGDLETAALHFDQCLQSAKQAEDQRAMAAALGNLANVEIDRGRPDTAIERLRDVVAIFRDVGDRPEQANAMSNLGVALMDAGRLDEAESEFHEALGLARASEKPRLVSNVLTNLGNIRARRGDNAGAISYYGDSLEIDRDLGDARGEATNLYNMADKLLIAGDLRAAEECARLALDMRTRIKDPRIERVEQKLVKILSAIEERKRLSSQE